MTVVEILGLITAFIRDLGLDGFVKAGIFIFVAVSLFSQLRSMLNK
jgi:hypothetical protein